MNDHADLIITNARILTMDAGNPRVDALAVAGGLIAAVGSASQIMALRGNETRVIDARGASVLPGFIESHAHLFLGAAELSHLQLGGVFGLEALAERLAAYTQAHPDLPFLIGQSCDYDILGQGQRLTRQMLDAIIPNRPVALVAADHHTVWANTMALEMAEVLHGRELSPGNEIVMGEDGLAAGELREFEAMAPLFKAADMERARIGLDAGTEPEDPSADEREADKQIMRRGLAYAASFGITSFHNMDGNLYQLDLLEEIGREGGLICRAQVPFHFKHPMTLSDLEHATTRAARYHGDWLKAGVVKLFMDGVLDSGTAHMLSPYKTGDDWRGEAYFSDEEFAQLATEIDRRGLQIAVHAIGDAAVRTVLDGYEAAARANGARDSRHRIEHIEVTTADDIPRFSQLGVIASMQPSHAAGAMDFPVEPTASILGPERAPYAYAPRTIRESGAHVVFSTDWPVAPINPILSMQTAMIREPWSPDLPDQRFSLLEAIHAYTVEGAYAEFAEDRKGRLKPGYFADIVVMSNDLESLPVERLHEAEARMTICGGRVTHEREAHAKSPA